MCWGSLFSLAGSEWPSLLEATTVRYYDICAFALSQTKREAQSAGYELWHDGFRRKLWLRRRYWYGLDIRMVLWTVFNLYYLRCYRKNILISSLIQWSSEGLPQSSNCACPHSLINCSLTTCASYICLDTMLLHSYWNISRELRTWTSVVRVAQKTLSPILFPSSFTRRTSSILNRGACRKVILFLITLAEFNNDMAKKNICCLIDQSRIGPSCHLKPRWCHSWASVRRLNVFTKIIGRRPKLWLWWSVVEWRNSPTFIQRVVGRRQWKINAHFAVWCCQLSTSDAHGKYYDLQIKCRECYT